MRISASKPQGYGYLQNICQIVTRSLLPTTKASVTSVVEIYIDRRNRLKILGDTISSSGILN